MDLNNDYLQDAQYKSANNWSAAASGTEVPVPSADKSVRVPDSTTMAAIVGGTSVTTVVTTDFEKLLATLQLETEETKRKNMINMLADVVNRLVSAADNLSTADKTALQEIANAQKDKEAAEADISKYSSLIELKTQELETLTKNMREIQEEINKLRAEQKEENAEEIAKLESQLSTMETTKTAIVVEVAGYDAIVIANQVKSANADKAIANAENNLSTAALTILAEAAKIVAAANTVEDKEIVESEAMKKFREKFEVLEDVLMSKVLMKKIPASELPGHEIKA